MTARTSTPRVSIITATYNRSNVLRHAIESARCSSFRDWEMIVVGDACTDDSAEQVKGLGDPRIRFVNLERNFGEQSGPNNAGLELARAPLIAYLNHDDLWFPDHLELALSELESSGAALVFTVVAYALPAAEADLLAGRWSFGLTGIASRGRYRPGVFAPASCWLLRRELLEELGGWRPAAECFVEPSQDLLFRAWRRRRRLRALPQITVLAVQSGSRSGVYRRRDEFENRFFAEQMQQDPLFREKVLRAAALTGWFGLERPRFPRSWFLAACRALRIDPRAVSYGLRYGRGGNYVRRLRRRRGLEARPR